MATSTKTSGAAGKTAAAKPAAAKKAAAPRSAAKKVATVAAVAKPVAAKKAPAAKRAPAAKTVLKASTAPKPVLTAEQRNHYVSVAAFYIAERRGFTLGNPSQDWLDAEAEIDRLIASGHFMP